MCMNKCVATEATGCDNTLCVIGCCQREEECREKLVAGVSKPGSSTAGMRCVCVCVCLQKIVCRNNY